MSYDRYNSVRESGNVEILPYIKLKPKYTDKKETYVVGYTRFDLLSYKYYKDASYSWLILLANPQFSGLEFNIEDGTILTIPYPLEISLDQYNNEMENYKKLYGFE